MCTRWRWVYAFATLHRPDLPVVRDRSVRQARSARALERCLPAPKCTCARLIPVEEGRPPAVVLAGEGHRGLGTPILAQCVSESAWSPSSRRNVADSSRYGNIHARSLIRDG